MSAPSTAYAPEPADRATRLGASVRQATPLFIGLALLMVPTGLQGSLLGIRAGIEGFDPTVTGFVMSAYYVGFVVGSRRAPALLTRIGHIRTFSALAAIAAVTVLAHAAVIHPLAWAGFRVANGFAMSGLYITVESWLNAEAANEIRGRILSIYLVIVYGGMALGALLLNAADPAGYDLFVVCSALGTLAIVPLAVADRRGPRYVEPERMRIGALARLVPVGVVGCFVSGITQGEFFAAAAIYGQRIELTTGEISVFVFAYIAGGTILQFPIGALSDRVDRRVMIAATCAAAAALALVLAEETQPGAGLWLVAFAAGGLSLPLYGLAAAHANDELTPEQVTHASGALVLAFGAGAVLGPAGGTTAMDVFGDAGFLGAFAATNVVMASVTIAYLRRPGAHRAHFLETAPPEATQLVVDDR